MRAVCFPLVRSILRSSFGIFDCFSIIKDYLICLHLQPHWILAAARVRVFSLDCCVSLFFHVRIRAAFMTSPAQLSCSINKQYAVDGISNRGNAHCQR